MKTYLITYAELEKLADAISLLDRIKNRVPDECPEKADAEAASIQCHALIETLLGDDATGVYSPDESEEEKPLCTQAEFLEMFARRMEKRT